MSKQYPRHSRSRALDLVWEVLIALAIVCVLLGFTFFFAANDDAHWMPSPAMRRHIAWSITGFGLGVAYLYLALSTRRLEQKMSNMPYANSWPLARDGT